MSSPEMITDFCNLVKTRYSNLTLKELCQEASNLGINVTMPDLESWLKSRGIRVRKKHSYDLRAVERICQYSEQNPTKTHSDLQRLCEQVFGHKVEQSVIATWLSRRQINLRKTRASKKPYTQPQPNSTLSPNEERLLHYAPGFKRVRSCAGGDPQTVLLMLQFVYDSLLNKSIVTEAEVRIYLENVHGIIKRTEQITTLFRRYTLTHRLRDVKLKRCLPEQFIHYIRETFPEIPEPDGNNVLSSQLEISQCISGMKIKLPVPEVVVDSDGSQPTTPNQDEQDTIKPVVVVTPSSNLDEMNAFPINGEDLIQSYQCHHHNHHQYNGSSILNLVDKSNADYFGYFDSHQGNIDDRQQHPQHIMASSFSHTGSSGSPDNADLETQASPQSINYMYSLQGMEYYSTPYQYSGYYDV